MTKKLSFKTGFRPSLSNERAQAAEMTIAPGESEGGRENKHPGADQWLFVVSGKGTAILAGKKHQLSPGNLLLIDKGTTHEIKNTGKKPLQTLNFYVPPAYTPRGQPLSRAKAGGNP